MSTVGENPYLPPRSNVHPQAERRSVLTIAESYGGGIIFRRWLGTWIDFAGSLSCLVVPEWLLGNELYRKTLVVWVPLAISYFVVAEWLWGRTLGKLLTGTIVVSETGGRPSLWQVVVRTLFRLVEVNPVVAGGIPAGIVAALSKRKQRIGDMAAGTYVIRSSDGGDSLGRRARVRGT